MANSADPDQLASSEANWSGSTLFAKAGYIRVQQDKGKCYKHMSRPTAYWLNQNWLWTNNIYWFIITSYTLVQSWTETHFIPKLDWETVYFKTGLGYCQNLLSIYIKPLISLLNLSANNIYFSNSSIHSVVFVLWKQCERYVSTIF